MIHAALSEDTVLDLLKRLIAVRSVNPALSSDESAGEAAIADFARSWLEDRGVSAWLEEAAPGRPNVVAEVGAEEGRTLILCGHLDTVSADGMTVAPFEPKVDGDRVYGRGAYDMKGGVAAIMAAAAALKDEGLGGCVSLALVADEEHSSIGADHFVANHGGDACIVTEPTENRLVLTHKGFVWARIETRGVAAHGSRPDLGESAIEKMGAVIGSLRQLNAERLARRTHPQLGPASLHPSLIRGGVGISTYAADCELQVERRTLPGEKLPGVIAELREAIAGSGEKAKLDVFFSRQPLVCDPASEIAGAVREAAESVTGSAPEEAGVSYWADAAIFSEAGIPTLMYGPAGEGAHGAVEWVSLSSVVTTARVLFAAARIFCGERC